MNRRKEKSTKITRRDFIKVTGTIVLVAGTRWNLSASDEIPSSDGYFLVDKEKCIGCGTCYDVCPYTPSRPVVAADKDYGGEVKSRKCDLCANTPFHWDEAGGGPDGKQACVAVCPVGAIKFTNEIPEQKGDTGYKVNLRGPNWGKLGYPSS